jgi:hypothetical protein
MAQNIYHVMRRPDDTWQVLKEGFKRPHIIRSSREEAIVLAKRLARVNPDSTVIVHDSDNEVEREFRFIKQAGQTSGALL